MEQQVTNNYYYQNGRPMANNRPQPKPIDWKAWFEKLLAHRKAFYITLPAAFIVGCIIMISVPNYYDVQVKLVPELGSSNNVGSGLGSLLSTFGMGGGTRTGADAVTPTSYPDLMNSKAYQVRLFDIQVESLDKSISTTYYDYLSEHQKAPWWSQAIGYVTKGIASLLPAEEVAEEMEVNPYHLTTKQDGITKVIGRKIMCDVDKKTAIITINATDQDPLICATIADSACVLLQEFITEYRTKKARQELDNIQAQLEKTRLEYEEAKEALANFNNSNWSIVREDVKLQQQFLQQDMSLKYSAYSAFTSQMVAARTKLEESRPVYTVLDAASVPITKSGPKRSRTVLVLCFLVFCLQAAWILRKELLEQFSTPAPTPTQQPSSTTNIK